jgi:2-keto-4-pentenoate hydratase/2-oxohepta-3-ene-1,7-dioic acid hydratase in catechol pathway
MRFRRTLTTQGIEHQVQSADGSWHRADQLPLWASPFSTEFERDLAEQHIALAGGCLPFQPLSFRDFMLSRQHVIDASRGLVSRFHPHQARIVDVVERVTSRPFPKFQPHPLFDAQPIYYMSNHLSFVPSGTPVTAPSYSTALDYEPELGFILRDRLRDASPDQAVDAIGAFVVLNDFSARDVQRAEMATGLGPQKSKHFLSSMSQTAVTAEELLHKLDTLTGSVRINDKVVSRVSATDLRWTLGEVLAHASRSETLYPGELFATGTLAGGSGMETGHWLRDGDLLTLELEGVGVVEHRITQRG